MRVQGFALLEKTVGVEFGDSYAESFCESDQFKISNPADPALDTGNDVTGDIPSDQLAFHGKITLGEPLFIAEACNLGTTNIFLVCVKIHT